MRAAPRAWKPSERSQLDERPNWRCGLRRARGLWARPRRAVRGKGGGEGRSLVAESVAQLTTRREFARVRWRVRRRVRESNALSQKISLTLARRAQRRSQRRNSFAADTFGSVGRVSAQILSPPNWRRAEQVESLSAGDAIRSYLSAAMWSSVETHKEQARSLARSRASSRSRRAAHGPLQRRHSAHCNGAQRDNRPLLLQSLECSP